MSQLRLFDPANERVARNSFNTVQREITLGLGSAASGGEYTLVAFDETGSEVGRQTVRIEKQWAVSDATFRSEFTRGEHVVFLVENTGAVPIEITRLELLESSGTDGFEQWQTVFAEYTEILSRQGYETTVPPGQTRGIFGDAELTFVRADSGSGAEPCAGWSAERTYELVAADDSSITVDLTIEFGAEYETYDRPHDPIRCQSGDVVEFSGGTSS